MLILIQSINNDNLKHFTGRRYIIYQRKVCNFKNQKTLILLRIRKRRSQGCLQCMYTT